MQRWWRCHEMTEPQRHRNSPKRSASAVANGAPAQSGNEPTPAPQPAATEKPAPDMSRARGRKFYAARLNFGIISLPLVSAVALSNARTAPSRIGWEGAKLLGLWTYVAYGFSLAIYGSHRDG